MSLSGIKLSILKEDVEVDSRLQHLELDREKLAANEGRRF